MAAPIFAEAGTSPATSLDYVNPELRPMAEILTRVKTPPASPARRSSVAPTQQASLPEGVERRMVPGQEVPGHGVQPTVPVYIMGLKAGTSPRGAILHIHGGGYMAGSARGSVRWMMGIAERLNCVIVSVEYRLAPDTPFPGALDDNYAALKWLHGHAGELGVDPQRIAILGESAGGGHAAMLAIAARDRKEVPIAFQALLYPMLDDRTGSTRTVGPTIGTLIWRAEDNRAGWSALLGRPAGSRTVPPGSVPARVHDLAGLPPTFIGVGSIDLFAEEDIDFAKRLVAQGVPTQLLVTPGGFHGFQMAVSQAEISKEFTSAFETALMRAVGSPPRP